MHNIALGKAGEDEAVNFLKKKGYKILERNWRLKRFGEIDIIAKDRNVFCFIEVKTRVTSFFGQPYEAVDKNKQFKLSVLAISYLKSKNLMDSAARFDIVSISGKKINLFTDAFPLSERFSY
ncbi:MAG: YraN family protein [Candidatus Omnitrophota bacterium]|nr:YraN family protein [Candidatus Omnitrophota bacterium]